MSLNKEFLFRQVRSRSANYACAAGGGMATMVLFAVLAGLAWPLTWGLVLSIFWIGALGGVPAVALNPRFRSNSAIIGSVTALGIAFIYIFVVVSQVQ